MWNTIKAKLRAITLYLSDTGHRRFVATVTAMVATYALGQALDAEQVALAIEIALGGLGAYWKAPSDA